MKKYVALCCCILAVCAVFGLTARLNYDQVENAVESIETSANVIKDDIESLHVITWIIENYDISNILDLQLNDHLLEVIINPEPFYDPDTEEVFDRIEKIFYFESMEQAKKIYSIVRPMTWRIGIEESYGSSWIIGVWNSTLQALGSVVYVLGIIVTLFMFVFWFLLDSVSTAWALVQASLYILGFNIVL